MAAQLRMNVPPVHICKDAGGDPAPRAHTPWPGGGDAWDCGGRARLHDTTGEGLLYLAVPPLAAQHDVIVGMVTPDAGFGNCELTLVRDGLLRVKLPDAHRFTDDDVIADGLRGWHVAATLCVIVRRQVTLCDFTMFVDNVFVDELLPNKPQRAARKRRSLTTLSLQSDLS